jgi:hypothetical protein
MTHLSDRDLEQLSAYLDGELKPDEAAEMATRLESEPELARTLAQLRWMTANLKRLPTLVAPRRYRLTPEMVGQRGTAWRLPALRLATAFVAIALVTVIGLDFYQSTGRLSMASAPQAFQAPAVQQNNLQAGEVLTDKTEQESGALGGGAATTEEGPLAESRRASGPSTEADSSGAMETPPVALAAPQLASTLAPPTATPAPPAPQPEAGAAAPSERVSAATGFGVLRWSEFLLGAGLVVLLAVQIKRRR